MVATRVQKVQHVIPMEEGGLMDVLQWLTMNDQTLSALTYKDASSNDIPLHLGDWHKIRVYSAMVDYQRLNSHP
jgi:hypothetical protein